MKQFFLFLTIILLASCNQHKEALFEQLSPQTTHIDFSNTLIETDTLNLLEFAYFYNGGGVGIGDVNNDDLPDIYFTGNQVSSRLYLNKGNLQFEDITQTAGVQTDRWARGVSMVDINADGLLDMYISVAGTTRKSKMANLLFVNQGNNPSGIPLFKEQANAYGLADTTHTTQTAFLDYDKDGDLDAYLLTNAIESFSPNLSRPKKINGEGKSTDHLYRNEGPGPDGHPIFKDVSREAGITIEGYGLGIAVGDLNTDGWPDIYCANDFVSNDLVWINKGDGTFTNQAALYLQHQSYNGMGTDIADFNNDGLPDIVVLDMLPEDNKRQKTMGGVIKYDKYVMDSSSGYEPQFVRNTLQLNCGMRPVTDTDSSRRERIPIFSEIGQLAGISNTDWSWSALFADVDNDGYRDLFITNGYAKDITDLDYVMYHEEQRMQGDRETIRARQRALAKSLPAVKVHNYLYQNNRNLTFTDQSGAWGLAQPTLSNGAAYADLDNDGDLDLIINNINEPAGIYQNNLISNKKNNEGTSKNNSHHFLKVKLEGPEKNLQGLGTSIRLYYGGKLQVHEHSVYRGFQSTVENTIHFGLGEASRVDSVEITWPDGKHELHRNVQANQVLTIHYNKAQQRIQSPAPVAVPLLTEVSQSLGIDYLHRENQFVDFKSQPLLHQQYSRSGPGIAVGDVNGDGMEDFFVGGASGVSGKLFLQDHQSGKISFSSTTFGKKDKKEEDMGTLFFDADTDGDLDLYIVSGGSEFTSTSGLYQDRLYKNDGEGNFTQDTTALPRENTSGSCVTAADFDRDGDLDLFIGGRVLPTAYPYIPQSYLLRNDKGKFTNISSEINAELASLGMVTAALWTDFDNNGWVDLIITGEWMPLHFFSNQQGKLTEVTAATGLSHTTGWWNSLVAGDFDKDGDTDYVAGNLGANSKYKASPNEPVRLYADDFDESGTLDPVLSYYLPDKDGKRASFPAHPRDELIKQVISMRKRFASYAAYAVTPISDLFSEKELKKAFVLQSEHFQTSYLENLGNGKFTLKALPIEAQFAPVYGMVCNDYDSDGNLDLLLSGNSYAPEVQTGQYDALLGLYLRGDGRGNFIPWQAGKSGFFIEGDAKGMAELILADGRPLVLSAINSRKLKSFTLPSHQEVSKQEQLITLAPMDAYADITLQDGKKWRQEGYYGSTYLSHSTRVLRLPRETALVTIVTFDGKRRKIDFSTALLK